MVTLGVREREPVDALLRSPVMFGWFDSAGVEEIPPLFVGEVVEKFDLAETTAADARPGTGMERGVMMPGQRRGRVIAMSVGEMDAFLGEERTCRLATLGPDGPHVSPVWFVWDAGEGAGALWVYSLTRSQRWADLQRDPRVAVVIDAGHHYAELRGVEIEGEAAVVGPVPRTADEDPQTPELAKPERLMAAKYQHPGGGMIHDGRHAWLRITPAKITTWDFRKLASLPPRP